MLSKHVQNKPSLDLEKLDADEIDYAQRRKNFGKLVKSLRQERKWTQTDLVAKLNCKLPFKTVGNIERGKKVILDYVTVKRLADAFELSGLPREEFFGHSGLNMIDEDQHTLTTGQENLISAFYKGIDYPAYVHDPLFNLHSANSCMFAAFGIKLDIQTSQIFSTCKGNLLRILFDPRLTTLTTWIKGHQWRSQVERLVYMFRILSKNQVGSSNYLSLLRELNRLPEFQDVWKAVEKTDFIPQFPIPTRFSLRTGEEFEFIITSSYDTSLLVSHLTRVLYVPVDDKTKATLVKVMANIPRIYARLNTTHPQGFTVVTP